jgi:diguanylate cyclase (GGDEF)-like protein
MNAQRRLTARIFVAIALAGMLVLGSSIYFGVNYAVERAVAVDAERKAADWAAYFIDTMPRISALTETGALAPDQLEVVAAAEKLGDVFRFKLFDKEGGLVLVSDEAMFNLETPGEREHSDKAATVVRTGKSNISVNDGTGKANRPPLYVEAYVPMFGPEGELAGIVEVYIDQTGTAGIFRTTFAALAMGLALVAALAFGLPTLAFLFRSRQVSEARQRVEFLAHHDPMTGLLNRGTFTDRLEAALKLAESPGRPMAVAFFDVDDFKAINDSYGHEAGDEFLKHVARCLEGLSRDSDLVSRPGGDEFIVALMDRTAEEVTLYVEAVMQAVRQPITIRGKAIAGRLSAGFYLVDPGATLADAMHKADVALYQAKIDGRNTHRMFSAEMESTMTARRALEQLVREAAANQGFELHFQPLLRADTKKCAGFEALLRLPDGNGGMIPPSAFIPVAEGMGLINEIGSWVLREATRVAASWPDDLFVAVNLSVKQFADGKLIGHVKEALAASGLRPAQLELEVTESMLIENADGVGLQLKELRALGVSVAMDDFGTGYSSLGYLWQFGFDKLKIDRSFVAALDAHDQRAREIVDTIIMLGHKLAMTVTAEGIETEYHASVLAELACDHFQGYLYGRPAPATDLAAFLLENRTEAAPGEVVARRA